jgi:hypothetical protein
VIQKELSRLAEGGLDGLGKKGVVSFSGGKLCQDESSYESSGY